MDNFSTALNNILVEIYRDVINLEEKTLKSVDNRIRLSIREIHFLEAVSMGKEEGLSVSELAEVLDVTKPSVTVAVNKLEKKGYLERRHDENDGRSVKVILTAEGAKINAFHQYYHRRMVKSISDDLTEEEKQFLVSTISKLSTYFKQSIENIK